MLNNSTIVGRLTANPELRHTSSGKAVMNVTVAVNRRFDKNKTDFIPVVVWGKTAEFLANYAQKGSRVGVIGSIQTDSYEKEGQRIFKTEIIADRVELLETKNERQGEMQQNNSPYQPADEGYSQIDDPDSLPF